MTKHYFLGVDGGGTKSHALVADENGQALGFAQAGPGSWEVVDWDGARRAIHTVVRDALADAGLEPAQITGAGFGLAGYDWPGQREPHARIIDALGLGGPYALVNDTIIGLVAGTTTGWGIGVVSGTGSNCWGRDSQGRQGRVTGCGSWFGEYAGAGDIVRKALHESARGWAQRGPETALLQALMDRVGATSPPDFFEGVVMQRYRPTAKDAPLVFQIADQGDAVAQDIIRWAGRELGSLVVGVVRQLSFETLDFEIVQIGSMFNGSPVLAQTMLETIHTVAPGARLTRLDAPPVIGGVLLGMETAHLDPPTLRPPLLQSTRDILIG